MRPIVMLGLFLFSTLALAEPKHLNDFIKESQKLRKELAQEKSFSNKLIKIQSLEKELKVTIEASEKAHPEKGPDAEIKVYSFMLSLKPVTEIITKKPTPDECKKARHRVSFEDLGTSPDNTPLSPEAQEATAWIDLLCS